MHSSGLPSSGSADGIERLSAMGNQIHSLLDQRNWRLSIISPGSMEYDSARQVFNGMIDHHPILIIACESADDVRRALDIAHEFALPVSVRSGGHGVRGSAIVDGGLVIDLSRMAKVSVNFADTKVSVQPGIRLGKLDRATGHYGLAVPAGVVSYTGLGGLALGGGLGWLMGAYGLTCDNILEAEVVLADGRIVYAGNGDGSDADLLWAIKGGGGSFGIVTHFTFSAHPVRSVYAGTLRYPVSRAEEVLAAFAELAPRLPDDVTLSPALSFTPDRDAVLAIDGCGLSEDSAQRWLRLLRAIGPNTDTFCQRPFEQWQTVLDDPYRRGRRHFWKSLNMSRLSSESISSIVQFFQTAPSSYSMLTIDHIHGAAARVSPSATAFGSREEPYVILINGIWADPQDDSENQTWVDELFGRLRQSQGGSANAYMNYVDPGKAAADVYLLSDTQRLLQLKARYDPEDMLGMPRRAFQA